MKKLASLFATSALALGVALVAPAANAADPYPQSVETTCTVTTNTPVQKGNTVRVRVNWFSAGNATPRGDIQVNVIRRKDDKLVRSVERYFSGDALTFKFRDLRPSGYKVRIVATAPATSVFKSYRTSTFFRVTR
ncbi:hypothetical protein ACS3YM_14945 [Nocardia sp. N13]|uniref:hypothetical protein n=1 Tax=Nocardioides sp. N13(2025) TaxID=3453405 RepID=UPI003F75B0A7